MKKLDLLKVSCKIEQLKKPSKLDLKGINRLLPQQADKPHLLNMRELRRVTEQDCIEMYVARSGNEIAGMASVIFYWVPTGLIAFIEEFTVDRNFRGWGMGVALINKLIERAVARDAKHISTYTNPSRIAANAVYQKLGFFNKETNFYRINIKLPKPSNKKAVESALNYK